MIFPRRSIAACLFVVLFALAAVPRARALPAFARKYGLRCSACHETWPILNNFGLKFKDNGYQLMNDRDSPIWQNPSYWPITFRMTTFWHRISQNTAIDNYVGIPPGTSVNQSLTTTGFDLSGLDILTGGTLEKNISFLLVPSADNTGAFHFESVNARFDNLLGSPWLNVKLGKFELNNLLSEKRSVALAGNGGYATYHFIPPNDQNIFGQMGDNQLGLEYLGHSANDRTRVSAALLSSVDGNVNLTFGSNSYSTYLTFDQGFDAGKLGVQRLGAYYFGGEAATYYRTSGGIPIPGSGIGNKGFYRVGFTGQFYFGPHFDVNVVTQHGSDNVWFGQGYGNAVNTDGNGGVQCVDTTTCLPNNTPGTVLLPGSRAPSWNGYLIEARYVFNPQMIFLARYEAERMSQQANGPGYVGGPSPSNLGNINLWDIIFRWNPFMSSRAGMAIAPEYNVFQQVGAGPPNTVTGVGTTLNSSELLLAVDFDF
ncbi:MAG TPA: hypothetical protein VMH03_04085 [Terriglobales bacterium]|nr:hypothetical protein [Terriglobales bacterium]